MSTIKNGLIAELERRVADKILEPTNAELLKKLIKDASSDNEAMMIAELGTTYKRTGLHFDKRLEKMTNDIRYFKKNKKLSFHTDDSKPTHKLIIGDNYEALQNLLIQYKGMIDVIYIDPPYGKGSMGEFAQTNYENAITRDNLLSMLYPRLMLAKMLLSDNGVIFCSIDDKNQAYVKCLFDEVFGEKNFVTSLVRKTKSMAGDDGTGFNIQHEYLEIFAKNKNNLFFHGEIKSFAEYSNPDNDPNGPWCQADPSAKSGSDALYYPITNPYTQKKDYPPKGRFWAFSQSTMQKYIEEGRIKFKENHPDNQRGFIFKRYKNKMENVFNAVDSLFATENAYMNQIGTLESLAIFDKRIFDYPKPISFISKLTQYSSNSNSIILDFFAGSGTTGHAVLDMNDKDEGSRTFILCQLNEITNTTPHGIAYDVTAKRLKRIMTGKCYDGTKDFEWIKKNKPYGGNLDVYEIASVANFETTKNKTPFDVIDETLYGKKKFATLQEKIEWVCGNFSNAQKTME